MDFCIVYTIDSFQDHMTSFFHCVPKLLLSRPFDLIFALYTQLTPSKNTWPNFVLCIQLTHFKTIWSNFIIVYPIDSFQDHMTWFLHCLPNWLLSRPYDLILSLCTQLTPFKTIWPNFIIVHPIDSRPFHVILSLCTQLTFFKTIYPDFHIVYPNYSFQDDLTYFYHCVPNCLLSRQFDPILSSCTQLTQDHFIWFIIVYPIDFFSRP